MAEYVRTWLDSAHEQSPKTLERYRELAERQVIPHLGSVKLQKLKLEAIRAWHHAHRLLRLVLGYAVKSGTLTRNVAPLEGPPKVEDREIEILSPEAIKSVLDALQGHSLHPIVSLALATGMRRGELLGLQWGDVNSDGAALRVKRSLEETKAGMRLKPPKTKRGKRSITLPSEAVAMLRAYKVQQTELRLVIGLGAIKPDTLVFCTIEGVFIRPRNLTKAWDRARTAMKLPAVSFHAFRHSYVSMLIKAGVDILTISRRLGHGKATITLDVYGHLIDGADAAAAKAIEGVLK